jgi:hypothetical protein
MMLDVPCVALRDASMMLDVPCVALRDALNDDGEFRQAARYWDASLRLGIGGAPLYVRIEAGRVALVRPAVPDDPADVAIDGPAEEWEQLLAPVPRPFYQSIHAAATHHAIELSGDPLHSYAYLAALTRLIDVMRAQMAVRGAGD